MTHRWGHVAVSVVAVLGACGDGKQDDGGGDGGRDGSGVVVLKATAFNGGAVVQTPRLVRRSSGASPTVSTSPLLAAAAPHTIDPASYRVNAFISGPATEAKITIKRIIASGDGLPGALLFGSSDGSGPGIEITLSNGTVDLSGLQLNPIPVGHYSRIKIWPSRVP